jgi:hypothetical protein
MKGAVWLLTLLVAGALLDGVALGALGLEDLGAGGRVAGGSLGEGSHRRRRTEAETRRENSRGEAK